MKLVAAAENDLGKTTSARRIRLHNSIISITPQSTAVSLDRFSGDEEGLTCDGHTKQRLVK